MLIDDQKTARLMDNRVDAALRMLGSGDRTIKQVLQHLFAEGVQAGKDTVEAKEVPVHIYPDPSHTRYGVTNFSTTMGGEDHRVYELGGHGEQREILRIQGRHSGFRAMMIEAALNAEPR